MSKLFCPLPWNSTAIRNNGDYRICCFTGMIKEGGALIENGEPLNLRDKPMDQVRNHELLKSARRSFLENKWPEVCERCKVEEAHGQKSGRSHAIVRLQDQLREEEFEAKIVESTRPDGEIVPADFPIEEMDIRFGNKCNLKCRSCGPPDSSGWYDEWYQTEGKIFYDRGKAEELSQDANGRVQIINDRFNWYEGVDFKEILPQQLQSLNRIYFAGGEPLLSREHQTFLKFLVDSGHSQHIYLEYNTNLSILPQSVLDLWSRFERIGVGVSMDGMGNYLEYLRYPIKFSTLFANLQKLEKSELPLQGWLSCTVSWLNISHLPDFMIWKQNQNFEKVKSNYKKAPFSAHLAHTPIHLNLRSLPLEAKQLVADRISKGCETIAALTDFPEERKAPSIAMLEGLVGYMWSKDQSADWSTYWNKIVKTDLFRKQKYADLDPQLAEILERAASA